MNDMPAALAAAVATRKLEPSADKLDRVRDAARKLRDLYLQQADLNDQLVAIKKAINDYESHDLVDIFNEAGVAALSLDAEGNLPAYDAEKIPFYSAKIPEGEEEKAWRWFEDAGHEELIKTSFTLAFGMGDYKVAKKFEDGLVKAKLEYNKKVGVHASTLLAFVKKELKANHPLPLDVLGVYVGEVVKLKARKEL